MTFGDGFRNDAVDGTVLLIAATIDDMSSGRRGNTTAYFPKMLISLCLSQCSVDARKWCDLVRQMFVVAAKIIKRSSTQLAYNRESRLLDLNWDQLQMWSTMPLFKGRTNMLFSTFPGCQDPSAHEALVTHNK